MECSIVTMKRGCLPWLNQIFCQLFKFFFLFRVFRIVVSEIFRIRGITLFSFVSRGRYRISFAPGSDSLKGACSGNSLRLCWMLFIAYAFAKAAVYRVALSLLSNYCMNIEWLLNDNWMTIEWLSNDHRMTRLRYLLRPDLRGLRRSKKATAGEAIEWQLRPGSHIQPENIIFYRYLFVN